MAFATAEDLATYMARDFSAEDTATATQALDIATSVIQGYTGQILSAVSNESITLRPRAGRFTRLPELPVTNIDSVTEDTTLLTVTTDYLWSIETGILWRVDRRWGEEVVVVYDHGYSTIPDEIKGVTLGLAARLFTAGGHGDAGAVQSEQVGMYQVTYQGGTSTLLPQEITVLRHYGAVLVA